MNLDIYLVSKSQGIWKQYPDYSKEPFFNTNVLVPEEKPVIVISRKGNMMYYSFLHSVNYDDILGITVAVNSAMIENIPLLAENFTMAWERLVNTDAFAYVDNNAKLRLLSTDWTKETSSIESFRRWFNQKLASISDLFCTLPPVNVNSEIGGVQYIDYTEDIKFSEEITDAFRKQTTTVVLFDKKIDTQSFLQTKQTIRQNVQEKNSVEIEDTNLKLKHKERVILVLSIFLFISSIFCIGIYITYSDENKGLRNKIRILEKENKELKEELIIKRLFNNHY